MTIQNLTEALGSLNNRTKTVPMATRHSRLRRKDINKIRWTWPSTFGSGMQPFLCVITESHKLVFHAPFVHPHQADWNLSSTFVCLDISSRHSYRRTSGKVRQPHIFHVLDCHVGV